MGDSFGILERLVRFTNARHGVIASNIANADTPGYKAKDLKFENMLDSAAMELKATNNKHIGGSNGSGLPREITADKTQQWADGNDVELDMEVAKMTENAMLFQAGITMLSVKIRMFKNALRR
jgi:flagellar basal-body rod protein FlgB